MSRPHQTAFWLLLLSALVVASSLLAYQVHTLQTRIEVLEEDSRLHDDMLERVGDDLTAVEAKVNK